MEKTREDSAVMTSPSRGTRKERSKSPSVRSSGVSKPRRPPPITPKRFSKFFTPRSSASQSARASASRAGRQLRDITTSSSINRRSHLRQLPKMEADGSADQPENGGEHLPMTPQPTPMKRKHISSPLTSPLPHSSPSKRPRVEQSLQIHQDIPSSPPNLESIAEFDILPQDESESISESAELELCSPIRRLKITGINGRIIERSFGGFDALGRGRRKDGCLSAKYKLGDFFSHEDDVNVFPARNIPFCISSCNTNSVVAVGTEKGNIRLLDTAWNFRFSETVLTFAPQSNAVIDMQFSADDSVLATACGDQMARLVDMRTQQTTSVFKNHRSSIKQVLFHPSDENVIATCSRDGNVNLWDIRCTADTRMVTSVTYPDQGIWVEANKIQKNHPAKFYYDPLIPIHRAHQDPQAMPTTSNNKTSDVVNGRSGDVSVTSLAFLSSSRSHLLVTASEANSSIKVWDIRSRYSRRATALPVPVSYTRVPDLHRQHRNFGINSLVLNGNESRLYALSRDSTLYAYSTNHLILGSAPELDPPGSVSSSSSNAHFSSEVKEGLGPLYGFRHPDFRATSFYVKAALRPARGDKPELIAVGNSHRTPILFSTDERDFQRVTKSTTDSSAESAASTPITGRSVSFRAALASKETVPIYNTGVALRHGHRKEVTGVEWSANGDLVTISDDFTARCWREDQEHARMLRSDQDEGADKYMCGWAEMEDGYDEVDG